MHPRLLQGSAALLLTVSFFSATACAGTVSDSLAGPKLAADWVERKSERSAGSVAVTPQGVVLKAEPGNFVMIRRRVDSAGTDRNPFTASVYVASERNYAIAPGLHLYWDNENYVSLLFTTDNHVIARWAIQGVPGAREFLYVISDSKNNGAYLRAVLTSRNVQFFCGNDGANWRLLGACGGRPKENAAPAWLILGRGGLGADPQSKNARPNFENDYAPDNAKVLIASTFRDCVLNDAPETAVPWEINLEGKESWEQALTAVQLQGIPRKWTLLGPRPDNAAQPITQTVLEPEQTDDWTRVVKDETGKPFRVSTWMRPEDDLASSYVDLGEILDVSTNVLAFARTEIEWPAGGPAKIWFDCNGRAVVCVNNRRVFVDDGRRPRGQICLPVVLKRGVNVIKVKTAQSRGGWGFSLRVEPADAGARIALLEKLLAACLDEAKGWRGAQGLMEIARRRQQLLDYPGALAAWDKALETFSANEEYRSEALTGKVNLLESLRDWPALASAGAQYLDRFPAGAGGKNAFRAMIFGYAGAGKWELAETRTAKWIADAGQNAEAAEWGGWVLAGAAEMAGQPARRWAALERLARTPALAPKERARAAFEAAAGRANTEYARTAAGQAFDPKELAAACQAYEMGIAVLPGRENAQVRAWLKTSSDDLKVGKHERALGGFWGAALLALCASDAEAAPALALSQAYTLPPLGPDPKAVLLRPLDEGLRQESWTKLGEVLHGVKFGAWKMIGPFENGGKAAPGPETNPDFKARHAGRGGEKDWKDAAAKCGNEYGLNLTPVLGDCRGGMAYAAQDFDVTRAGELGLWISARAGFFAWVDGRLVASRPEETYRLDAPRIPLKLAPGKHRLLVKLLSPGDDLLTVRAHISSEPELAAQMLRLAWWMREFGQLQRRLNLAPDFAGCVRQAQWKSSEPVMFALGQAYAFLCPPNSPDYWPSARWAADRYAETGQSADAVRAGSGVLARLRSCAPFAGRTELVTALTQQMVTGLLAAGDTQAADDLLRDFAASYPDEYGMSGSAQTLRGVLRQDFFQGPLARPFFERVLRDYPDFGEYFKYAAPGLVHAKTASPERILIESTAEAQTIADNAARQFRTGDPQDIERAVRNLSEALRTGNNGLIRISDSRYFPHYAGVREFLRSLLASLGGEQRAAYVEMAGSAADEACRQAAARNDAAVLESVAREYGFTPAAARALNQAGNLYMDRGRYGQAAAVFKHLLQDYRINGEVSRALLCAKAARAQLLDLQWDGARGTAEQLEKDFGSEKLTVAGMPISGAQYASRLREEIAQAQASQQGGAEAVVTRTLGGDLRRAGLPVQIPAPAPGPVAWAHPAARSAAMDAALSKFWPDMFSHLQSFPVAAEDRVFVSTQEALRAFDSKSGKLLWSQTQGARGALLHQTFCGFPVSCPTVDGTGVFLRVVSGRGTALECRETATGALRWSTLAVPELRKAVWLSDPAVANGVAVAVFLETGELNTHGLAAVNAVTGQLRWKCVLASGPTGIRLGQEYLGTSMQLGPPAVDRGVVYAPTGLGCVAAVNLSSGEAVWLSGYPRAQSVTFQTGNSGFASPGSRGRLLKLMARGPAAPLLTDDTVVVAPKDGAGVYAFDRRTGVLRWGRELLDARFLPGVCEGRVLAVDNGVSAIDAVTGALAWHCGLDSRLYGQPGYAGGILYLPTEDDLVLLNARNGQVLAHHAWDARIGPLANLALAGKQWVGVNENAVAAFGEGVAPAELPLFEARQAADAGNWEAAAGKFAKAARQDQSGEILPAVSGWFGALEKLGRPQEALEGIEPLLANLPSFLDAGTEFWKVSKTIYGNVLRTRARKPAPPAAEPPAAKFTGEMAYAWQLPGENPRLIFPFDGPRDRCLAVVGNTLCAVRLSSRLEVLWETFVGNGAWPVYADAQYVAVAGVPELLVLDRETGEMLWRIALPEDRKRLKARANPNSWGFGAVSLSGNSLAFVAGDGLYVYDLKTGKERWFNERRDRRPLALCFVSGKLIETEGAGGQDTYCNSYNVQTGALTERTLLGRKTAWTGCAISEDSQYIAYKPSPNLLAGVDLQTQKKWELQVPNLTRNWAQPPALFEFQNGLMVYSGESREGAEWGWQVYWINPADGKIVRKTPAYHLSAGNGFVTLRDKKTLVRLDPGEKTGLKEIWARAQPEHPAAALQILKTVCAEDRLFALACRSVDGVEQLVLRIYDWTNGDLLHNEILPGTPLRAEAGNAYREVFEWRNGLLLYGAQEGVFAFAPLGQTSAEACGKLRQTVADMTLTASERLEARRALAALDLPRTQAFLAPADLKIDGEAGKWAGMEPVLVQGPENFVPLAGDAVWNGPSDLTARFRTGWSRAGLALAIDVEDDKFCPPGPGMPAGMGDSVRVAVNSASDPSRGLSLSENLVCSAACVNGRTLLDVQPETADEDERVTAQAVPAADGKSVHYEFLFPWSLLRRNPNCRPGDRKDLRLGIAVYDNDGSGVKSAVEWGAGVTTPAITPLWLGQVSLVDISVEKVERYRKAIAKIPDTAEALDYLDLILSARRGQKADQERAAELEAFVRAQPGSQNVSRVLARLRKCYERMGDTRAQAKVLDLAKACKCSAAVLDDLSGKTLRIWVLPAEKTPPAMIMLQFWLRGAGWCRRAYWGESRVDWGRDGTVERLCLGPVPKPGVWTQLEVRPADFDMEDAEIQGVALVSVGGQTFFDRLAVTVAGKETVLLDDKLPANLRMENNALQFLDAPKHTGAKVFTGSPAPGGMNSVLVTMDASAWFSFKSPGAAAPPPNPQKLAALYREVASLLSDTPEGFAFLRRILDLFPKETALAQSIQECEAYLKAHPETQNANAVLQLLRSLYDRDGKSNAQARCEALIRSAKLSRDNCRAFYTQTAPAWMDWHVIGPFRASGMRRGLDRAMAPERGVDLTWKPKEGEQELSWARISAAQDGKGKPNSTGAVDLLSLLIEKVEKDARRTYHTQPYFAYACCKFNVPSKRRAIMLYGFNDIGSIWCNGKRVVAESEPGNGKDRALSQVMLRSGENEILIKTGVREGRAAFYFRIADENGRPFDDLTMP